MTTRSHSICLLLGLLAPLLACATTRSDQEQELLAKKAIAHFDLAVDHFDNGRVEIALHELKRANQLDPMNPRIHNGLAIAYLQKGKSSDAEHHLRRAIEISPDYHGARFNLSTLLLNQGRYEECVEHSKVLYDDPTFPSSWRALSNWGWAAYKLGREQEGRRQLEYARELQPGYWPTSLNLGILEAEQGHKVEAIRHFNAVLELRPGPSGTAETSYRLAEIYVSLGKRDEAVGHLRTAVVRAPSDPWGKKSEEYLKLLR